MDSLSKRGYWLILLKHQEPLLAGLILLQCYVHSAFCFLEHKLRNNQTTNRKHKPKLAGEQRVREDGQPCGYNEARLLLLLFLIVSIFKLLQY